MCIHFMVVVNLSPIPEPEVSYPIQEHVYPGLSDIGNVYSHRPQPMPNNEVQSSRRARVGERQPSNSSLLLIALGLGQ